MGRGEAADLPQPRVARGLAVGDPSVGQAGLAEGGLGHILAAGRPNERSSYAGLSRRGHKCLVARPAATKPAVSDDLESNALPRRGEAPDDYALECADLVKVAGKPPLCRDVHEEVCDPASPPPTCANGLCVGPEFMPSCGADCCTAICDLAGPRVCPESASGQECLPAPSSSSS